MIDFQEEFDTWCAAVPSLRKVKDGFWRHENDADVSFPSVGHSILTEIEPNSYWFKHRNNVIASVVKRYAPDGPIFDIGGGNGFVSLGLEKAGFNCIVVEPGATGAAVSNARGLPVIRAAFQNLDLQEGSIAAAGLFDVLEHIEDESGTLSALYRVLKPNGMAYIAVPAYNFLWSKEDVYAGHFRRYTLGRLKRSLRRAGFIPEYGTYFFSMLVPAIFLFRVLPGLAGFKADDQHAQNVRDHTLPTGLAGSILVRSFEHEIRKIKLGESVGYGSSCLVAARKQ